VLGVAGEAGEGKFVAMIYCPVFECCVTLPAMTRFLLVFWSLTGVALATPITGITTDNPASNASRADSPANLTSLSVGAVTWQAGQLVAISDVSSSTSGGLYTATTLIPPEPSTRTIAELFTDLDITSGKANSVNMNMIFDTPLDNSNGAVPDFAIFEIATTVQSDSWSVEAIVGGNAASPIFGGSIYTFNQSSGVGFGDTGHQVRVARNSTEFLDQDIYGVAIDFGLLGITSETVIGVRVQTSGGDPNLVVGLQSIPEPTALSLLIVGGGVLVSASRRFSRFARC